MNYIKTGSWLSHNLKVELEIALLALVVGVILGSAL